MCHERRIAAVFDKFDVILREAKPVLNSPHRKPHSHRKRLLLFVSLLILSFVDRKSDPLPTAEPDLNVLAMEKEMI